MDLAIVYLDYSSFAKLFLNDTSHMRQFANFLWHIPFLGFLTAFSIFIVGLLFMATIIGIPIGKGMIQLSKFMLSPFTQRMVNSKELGKKSNPVWETYGTIVRIFYFPLGLLFVGVLGLQTIAMFISIIGAPVAIVMAKSIGTVFNPVNKVAVPRAVAIEMEARNAQVYLAKKAV